MDCWFMGADGPYPPQWSRRRGLFVRNELISEAEAATHSLHIVPPPDDPGGHAAAGCVRRLLFLARTLARGSLIEMIFVPRQGAPLRIHRHNQVSFSPNCPLLGAGARCMRLGRVHRFTHAL